MLGLVQDMKLLQVALWDEHVFWTREVAASILMKLPSLQQAVDKLMGNQRQIANTFITKHGRKTAEAVHQLLVDHIKIAASLVGSLLGDDASETKRLQAKWAENGRQIAGALYSLRPSLASLKSWQKHMQIHLDLTTKEAVTYSQAKYAESQRYFVEALNQARGMAFLFAQLVT